MNLDIHIRSSFQPHSYNYKQQTHNHTINFNIILLKINIYWDDLHAIVVIVTVRFLITLFIIGKTEFALKHVSPQIWVMAGSFYIVLMYKYLGTFFDQLYISCHAWMIVQWSNTCVSLARKWQNINLKLLIHKVWAFLGWRNFEGWLKIKGVCIGRDLHPYWKINYTYVEIT